MDLALSNQSVVVDVQPRSWEIFPILLFCAQSHHHWICWWTLCLEVVELLPCKVSLIRSKAIDVLLRSLFLECRESIQSPNTFCAPLNGAIWMPVCLFLYVFRRMCTSIAETSHVFEDSLPEQKQSALLCAVPPLPCCGRDLHFHHCKSLHHNGFTHERTSISRKFSGGPYISSKVCCLDSGIACMLAVVCSVEDRKSVISSTTSLWALSQDGDTGMILWLISLRWNQTLMQHSNCISFWRCHCWRGGRRDVIGWNFTRSKIILKQTFWKHWDWFIEVSVPFDIEHSNACTLTNKLQ